MRLVLPGHRALVLGALCARAQRTPPHTLVGSTASFGADDVTALARDLETHAWADNADASRNTFTPL